MKNKILFSVLAAALLAAAASQPAMAEGKGRHGGKGKGGIAAACKEDASKFCKDTERGEGRLIACLKEHEEGLSEGCRTAFKAKKDRRRPKRPCAADMEKFCKDLKDGERAACMKEHKDELSEECRAKRAERKGKRKGKRGEDRGGKGRKTGNP